MPGLLAKIVVAAGEDVKAGQDLAVVEAMKMENVLRAEREARVVEAAGRRRRNARRRSADPGIRIAGFTPTTNA